MVYRILTSVLFIIGVLPTLFGQINPLELPLFSIGNFQYEGAFRVPANTYGSSSLNYSQGPIVFSGPDRL
jgi:hypothetical protein